MQNYKIDHLVVGSNCLEDGTYYIENLLDLKLSSIDYHKKMGTHNRVIKLGDLYLEVIAIDPDSKVEIKNTFFGLDKSFVKKKILLKPRLISFVISSTMNISSKFYPNKTYIERNKYKWNFMNPNQNILEKDLFPYSDSFPSIIHWLTPSPLEEMKKNFFKFERLEIELKENQIFYKEHLDSFKLNEKIVYKIRKNADNDVYPKIYGIVKNIKTGNELIIK